MITLKNNDVIFFNGDSITDCLRDRNDKYSLSGYVLKIQEKLKKLFPELKLEIYNRGVSGNRSKDVAERVKKELDEICPTIFVLLVGINDTWRRYDENSPTSAEEYYNNVEKVIREVKKYTDQIVIMEPFLVNAKDDKLYFYDDLYKKIIVLRSLAKKYSTEYIALDGRFAERSIQQDELLSNDGIHPTELGQEFIVEEFIKIINKSKS